MLDVKVNNPNHSIVGHGKKASKASSVVTIKYLQSQTNVCSSCRSSNEFNPELFLDNSHIGKNNEMVIIGKNNPGLVDAWWIDQ